MIVRHRSWKTATAFLLLAGIAAAPAGARAASDDDRSAATAQAAPASDDTQADASDVAAADAASEAARAANARRAERRTGIVPVVSSEETGAGTASETVDATAPGLSTGRLPTQVASAEIFRPAPVPNQRISQPGRAVASSDEAQLRPDVFRMREKTSGALSTTSSEYEHASRVGPAGGMSLSIPMD